MKNARIRLGQEILRRRKAMGMTQEELASRMGVSRQSVAKWETGVSQS
jgi:transcriptional regulator with XRE-family HTH domain